MDGLVVIVVGEMGMGKTTYIKENFLNRTKKKKIVYALVQKDFGKVDEFHNNIKSFVSSVVLKHDTINVVDEAKTAFGHKEPDVNRKDQHDRNLVVWLENSRKFNNAIIISFKMLRDIPLWLLGYCNYFVRFNTMDQIQFQVQRFKSFPNITDSLENNPVLEKYVCDEIKIR